jgi:hypothetical protein
VAVLMFGELFLDCSATSMSFVRAPCCAAMVLGRSWSLVSLTCCWLSSFACNRSSWSPNYCCVAWLTSSNSLDVMVFFAMGRGEVQLNESTNVNLFFGYCIKLELY